MWKRALLSVCLLTACSKKDDAPAPAPAAAPAAGGGSANRAQRFEKMKQRLDANGDGKISVDELKNATGRMKFDDPAAIDTDHDGFISDEELRAAMKARREAMHKDGAGSATESDEEPK